MKAKFMLAFFVLLFCSAPLFAQQACDEKEYPEWVFAFPQTGQEGQTLAINEGALFDPRNLRRDDQAAVEWMKANEETLKKALGSKGFHSLSVYRNTAGQGCFEVDLVLEPARSEMKEPVQTKAQQREEPQQLVELKVSWVRRVFGTLIGIVPTALQFVPGVSPWVGIGSSLIAAPVSDLVARPKLVVQSAGTQTAKKQKYDHDKSGSFAALWK